MIRKLLPPLLCFSISSVASGIDLEEIDPTTIGEQFVELEHLTKEVERPFITKTEEKAFEGAQNITFKLQQVELTGVTVFDPEDLKKIFKQYINKNVSLNELQKIANYLTLEYQEKGYILARVMLVPQVIKNGSVRFHAMEGNVDKVIFSGDTIPGIERRLEGYVGKILLEKPIKEKTLKRYLSLIGDMPGIDMAEELQLVDSFDKPVLFLSFKHSNAEYFASVDNMISRVVGPAKVTASATLNSTRIGGQTRVIGISSIHPNRMKMLHLEHENTIGSDGLKIQVSRQDSVSQPSFIGESEVFNGQGRKYQSQNTSFGLSYPIIRSQQKNLYVKGNFEFIRSVGTSNVSSTHLFYDKLRVLRLGGSYEFISSLWKFKYLGNNHIDFTLSKGLGILGAYKGGDGDRPLSREDGSPTFTKMELELSRLQFLPRRFYVQLGLQGQYSLNQLLSNEEFVFGGPTYGRGFKSSVIAGENGYAFKAELGHDSSFNYGGPSTWRKYVFYDAGIVYNDSVDQQESGAATSASSGGIGTMFVLFKSHLFVKFEIGKPFTHRSNEGNKHTRFQFKISYQG